LQQGDEPSACPLQPLAQGVGGDLADRGADGIACAEDFHEQQGEPFFAAIHGRTVLDVGGDIAASGDFDAAIVVRKIKSEIRAIKACYERELKSNPTLARKVAIEFTIEERGTVSGVKVTANSTGSAAVGSCVANAIQRFRFNPGPEGSAVTFAYPFVFAPQG